MIKKLSKYLILLAVFAIPMGVFAIEEENIEQNTEQNIIEDEIRLAIEEPSQIEQKEPDKTQKAYIDYNYLGERTPLLKPFTHKKFESGILKSIEPSVAYRAYFDFDFTEHEEEVTNYENALLDLNIIGKFRAPVEFKSQFNFLSMGHENYFRRFFKDQYLAFTAIPHHKVYVGHFRAPIGKEGSASSYTLPFLNRSQIAKNLGNARAMGAKIEGKYDLINYNLSVTSSDRRFYEFFPGLEFSGWTDLKPLGKTDGKWGELEIGGGINAGRRHADYVVLGSAVSYKYKKVGLFAEYAVSDGSNGGKGFTSNHAEGLVCTLAYNLTKKLQLVARYDSYDSNTHKTNKTVTEYSAGINYLIKGSALKLVLDYIYRQKHGRDANRLLVGFQVVL